MALRFKALILVLALAGGLLVLGGAVVSLVMLPGFAAMEEEIVRRNLARVERAIGNEVEHLKRTAYDWSAWDDTLQFLADGNEAYIRSNLGNRTFVDNKINLLAFFDLTGRMIWGKAYDLKANEPISLAEIEGEGPPPIFSLFLEARNSSISASTSDSTSDFTPNSIPSTSDPVFAGGLIQTSRGTMIVAAPPIMASSGQGPRHGILVMGRLITPEWIDGLAEQVALKIRFESSTRLRSLPMTNGLFYQVIDADELEAFVDLPGIDGQSALVLGISLSRELDQIGRKAGMTALILLGSGCLLFVILVGLFLDRVVNRPLVALTNHTKEIGETGDITRRLHLKRDDEIGELAAAFDRMLEALATYRRQIMELAYRGGVTEARTGILHNLRNGLTPLKLRLGQIKRRLDQGAPVGLGEHLERIEELADSEATGSGKGISAQELRINITELRSLLAHFMDETRRDIHLAVEELDRHVQALGRILVDAGEISGVPDVLVPVVWETAIRQALLAVGPRAARVAEITIDPQVVTLPPALATPAGIHFILTSLLDNAIMAISAREPGTSLGRILLSGRVELRQGHRLVHLELSDDGIGIKREHLGNLFRRSASGSLVSSPELEGERDDGPKSSGSKSNGPESNGQRIPGLFWSSSLAQAMGGGLFADSRGLGHGASFHLLLPAAEETTGLENSK
jgi:sensor domain CHASE-containing protein